MKLSQWETISGCPIEIGGVCHIRQPSLSDIRDIGYSTFFEYVGVIMFDPNELDENMPLVLPEEGAFLFLLYAPAFRQTLMKALPFFVQEEVRFNCEELCFEVIKGEEIVGRINNNNFLDIQSVIIQTIGGEKESDRGLRFQSKKAREIYEKCKARKKGFDKQKKSGSTDSSYTLPNVISSVCAKHPSLNFTNIWDLTILQLYDQFRRLSVITYESVEGLRWAAWGKDSIELSAWYKDLSKQ